MFRRKMAEIKDLSEENLRRIKRTLSEKERNNTSQRIK